MNNTLFDFTDYKLYLQNFAAFKKNQRPTWNLSRWSQELGLSSRSLLAMVLKGSRVPSPSLTQQFIEYFAFSECEAQYFKGLVQLEKYQGDPEVLELVIKRLRELSPKGPQFKLLDPKAFQAIAKWYYYAIRELTFVEGFRPEAQWIAKQLNFPVSLEEIELALSNLQSLGLLEHNSKGQLVASDSSITSTHDIPSDALKQFHGQCLDHAKLSLLQDPVEVRHITGLTCAIPSQHVPKLKRLLNQLEDEVLASLQDLDNRDSVYQFNIQLFPLTRIEQQNLRILS